MQNISITLLKSYKIILENAYKVVVKYVLVKNNIKVLKTFEKLLPTKKEADELINNINTWNSLKELWEI